MGQPFVGVDQSLNGTGIAVLTDWNDEPLYTTVVRVGELREGERLAHIYGRLTAVLKAYQPAGAALEGYAYDAFNKPFMLGEIGGVVRLAFAQACVPYVVVAPAQLKKYATGKGVAEKEDVQAAVKARFGVEIPAHDACDAYVLSRIARDFHLGRRGTVLAEAHVLKALREPPKSPKPRAPRGGVAV